MYINAYFHTRDNIIKGIFFFMYTQENVKRTTLYRVDLMWFAWETVNCLKSLAENQFDTSTLYPW